MCLSYVGVPEETSGIGYKCVNRSKKAGLFRPEWPAFYKDGGGGVGNAHPPSTAIKTRTIYEIGKKTVINHHRQAIAADINKYRAGIHLYLNKPSKSMLFSDEEKGMTWIECEYDKAVATDGYIVVALEVTPIKELVRESDVDEKIES